MPTRRALIGGVLAAALVHGRSLAGFEPATPGVERRYLPSRWGQLHVRVAKPVGRVVAPPLVLLHQSPLSGRMFSRILPLLARGRVAVAVDTPGYGGSDRPPERPPLDGYAGAIAESCRAAFGPRLDWLGYHSGTMIAAAIAAAEPARARRLVLVSVPAFAPERRASTLAGLGAAKGYAEDGSHLPPL